MEVATRFIALVLSASLVACASSGPSTAGQDAAAPGERIDLIVLNRSTGPVTAYALWANGPRVPLGEVRANASRRFTTPYRGVEVSLGVEVLAAPSVGTTSGPTTLSGSGGARPRETRPPFVTVQPDDVLEWEIRQTFPTVDLFYRRLPRP